MNPSAVETVADRRDKGTEGREETCRCAARDDALDSLKAKRGFGTRYETARAPRHLSTSPPPGRSIPANLHPAY